MAHIVFTDDGIVFDGTTPETGPLGGAESALIGLAESLAERGHRVSVRNKCMGPIEHKQVHWAPLEHPIYDPIDLHVANRNAALLGQFPAAKKTIFWIHNPAQFLVKPRYLWPLWRHRPAIVFSGAYHKSTYPDWAPSGDRLVIPYGIDPTFLEGAEREPPPPRAIFTSNPLRSLDWLLDLWEAEIQPQVPEAELMVFSGQRTYGSAGEAKSARMAEVLVRANGLQDYGVRLREPVAKTDLREALTQSRVMLYRGDPGETFCLALAEAQAMGVPAVVQPIGSVGERVVHQKTGVVAPTDAAFVQGAIDLLRDDDHWRQFHKAALADQKQLTWQKAAADFEKLIGSPS